MRKNLLLSKMVLHDIDEKALADGLSITLSTLRKKMNEEADFTVKEVLIIKEILHLNNEEFLEIFFT